MRLTEWDFMHPEEPFLPHTRTLSEALAALVRKRFKAHTAKTLQTRWGIDEATAKNVIRGKASGATISKAIQIEGWRFGDALIQSLLGETRDEFEEREIRQLIEKTENARSIREARRERRAALAERARAVDESLDRHAS